MTTMIVELYDALKEAGASDEKAKAAASAIADYEKHFARIESDLVDIKAEIKVVKTKIEVIDKEIKLKIEVIDKEINLLKWMSGFVIAGIISMIIKLFI